MVAGVSTAAGTVPPLFGGPFPRTPLRSRPQHFTLRSDPATAQKCNSPPSTLCASLKPRTSSGDVTNSAVLAVASLPSTLYPQHTTLPVLFTAHAPNSD